MSAVRGKYEGVLNILRYNVHFYLAAACMMLGIGVMLWLWTMPYLILAGVLAAGALTLLWSLGSLLVSWYIYDHVGITRWNWLPQSLAFPPKLWLNVHAGLDESTNALARLFPGTGFEVVDIYDRNEMTERSIARARRANSAWKSATPARLNALPLPDGNRDTLFLLFAAHEVRDSARRVELFKEAARVLEGSGQLLLVEHLRNWQNFAAFGLGFLHFYARDEWLRVAREAGLMVQRETRITPFVMCALMGKVMSKASA